MQERHLPAVRYPSAYEKQALDDILKWRTPDTGWFTRTSDSIQNGLSSLTEHLRKVPGVDWTIDNVVTGLVTVTNEIAQDLVWQDAIFEEFRSAGHHHIEAFHHIPFLDLAAVDERLVGLPMKYKSLAAVEGVATGLAGAAGILPDILALITMNLRAAGEYATYCGFDISEEQERLFALQILDVAAKSKSELGPALQKQLHQAPNTVARRKTLNTIRQLTVSGTVKTVAKSLALKVTKSKLAQVLPVAGAVVAGGYNSLYTHTVCDVAYHLYRERFLFAKYGNHNQQ